MKITETQLKELKKGSIINGTNRIGCNLSLRVTSKLRTLKNGVGVVRMIDIKNPKGAKYSYYLRTNGYIGLAYSDMPTSLDIVNIEI